jgi:hypothetical protein
MTNYIEEHYIHSEYDEIFNNWYEIEGLRKIRELSRQLRTFFNYKAEVIRYRFHPSPILIKNYVNTKFFSHKQKIESLAKDFITLLKNVKKSNQTVEEGIHSLFFNNNKAILQKLLDLTEKLFILIHYLSEESIYDHPKFLKFIMVLAQNTSLVKKCLNAQFSKFYEELEKNYNRLEGELEVLLEKEPTKPIRSKTQLEERLTS